MPIRLLSSAAAGAFETSDLQRYVIIVNDNLHQSETIPFTARRGITGFLDVSQRETAPVASRSALFGVTVYSVTLKPGDGAVLLALE
jgi:hypothetical protein